MIIENLIYILQSENYEFVRFFNFAYRHLAWWKLQKRQRIAWPAKARLLQVVSWVIFCGSSLIFLGQFFLRGLFGVIALIFLMPAIVGIALLIIQPVDIFLKKRKIKNAKHILSQLDIIVIGIAGSYGKTSTKEILAHILEKRFAVVKTPGNVNTDLGIADFIFRCHDQLKVADIFIVEMGAYRKGEITSMCDMIGPTYSILTGINESHLERFGNIQNTIEAKFELPQHTLKLSVLNFDDDTITKNFANFAIADSQGISLRDAQNIAFKEHFSGIEFEYDGAFFETKLLAQHNITLICMCAVMAERIGMEIEDIREAVCTLAPVAHRLEPLYNKATNVMVIDDSYNGNFNGIISGIEVITRARGRKIVLTPGLVELGSAGPRIHRTIGRLYAASVDLVLLIKSPMTNDIIEGMQEAGFENFHCYENTDQAHGDLPNVLKNGDTIIFQNDLTDNYF